MSSPQPDSEETCIQDVMAQVYSFLDSVNTLRTFVESAGAARLTSAGHTGDAGQH